MGHRRLGPRHRQAQRRRALCLSQGRPRAHDKRPPHEPNRRTPALELESLKRRNLTDVQEMDAYDRACNSHERLFSNDLVQGIALHTLIHTYHQRLVQLVVIIGQQESEVKYSTPFKAN